MEKSSGRYFCIADHRICIVFCDETVNSMHLLPSFRNFESDSHTASPLLFTLTVDDQLKPAPNRNLVRKFDTGNGDTIIYQLPDGGYQYIIRDIMGNDCCLLITNSAFSECQCALHGDWTMRSFGLNNALIRIEQCAHAGLCFCWLPLSDTAHSCFSHYATQNR